MSTFDIFQNDNRVPLFIQISAVCTGPRSQMERSIKRVKVDDQSLLPITLENARSKLDSRADTICAGLNCRLIRYTGQ